MSQYSSKWLKVSEPSPQVLLIELARGPVNAFSAEFWRAYGGLFDQLVADGYDVRAAVVSSAFPKIFTAGLDLQDASALDTADAVPQDGARAAFSMQTFILEFQRAIGAPERVPFPVIAAVHGPVIGLGVDLIGVCDIRYAASNSKFAIKEVDIGLAPDIGTLAYLPKVTGNQSLLRELAYSARFFSAAEAEKIGLVSKVVAGGKDEVVKEALELAKFIASKSPVAVSGAKHLINHSRDHTPRENLEYTAVWNSAALATRDISDLLRAIPKNTTPKFAPLALKTKVSKL